MFSWLKAQIYERLVQNMMGKESASQAGAHGDNHGRDMVIIHVNDVEFLA